jgi:hypothetical protein
MRTIQDTATPDYSQSSVFLLFVLSVHRWQLFSMHYHDGLDTQHRSIGAFSHLCSVADILRHGYLIDSSLT